MGGSQGVWCVTESVPRVPVQTAAQTFLALGLVGRERQATKVGVDVIIG